MRGTSVRTERTQTCLSCGATVHLPKSREPLLCFRCRASLGARGAAPGGAGAPFQKIASPARRSPLNVRTTGLLFALLLVVAAVVALRGRGAAGSAEGAGTPSPSQAPRRDDTESRKGGIDVILVGPEPRPSK
jgi:hypothetical protein